MLRYGGVKDSMMLVNGLIQILYMRGITSLGVR